MNQKAVQTSNFSQKIRQCLSDIVYSLFRLTLIILFRSFFKVRIVGLEHCPKNGGPLMVVSNHISEWDPPFLGACLPWQAHWMAKVELFELLGGWMSIFFRTIHCIPVNREKSDLNAIKTAVRLLKGKRPMVVFAEGGTREDETSLLGEKPQLKEGAATMALMAGCPLLPVLLNGTIAAYQLKSWLSFRKHTLEVVIGPVFKLEGKDRSEATRQILEHTVILKKQLIQQKIC